MANNLVWVWIGIGVGVVAIGTIIYGSTKKGKNYKEANNESKDQSQDNTQPYRPSREVGATPAKEVFIKNIDKFQSLWDALAKEEKVPNDINEVVIGLNNAELTNYWIKLSKNPTALKRILATWGISDVPCLSFTGMKSHTDLYTLGNGSPISEGVKYEVTSPCWLLTTTNKETNVTEKKVIKKGIVKLA